MSSDNGSTSRSERHSERATDGGAEMAQSKLWRFESGEFTVKWIQAGDKVYKGLAFVRSQGDKDISMLRLTPTTSADEYRSMAQAALAMADMCEKAAVAAETAKQDAAPKLDKAAVERVRESLKNQKPADRLAVKAALGVAGIVIALSDFGYSDETGKPVAENKPIAPTTAADVAKILAAAGK